MLDKKFCIKFPAIENCSPHGAPHSWRLALHPLDIAVHRNMDDDVWQWPRAEHRCAVVCVVKSEVCSLWTQLPVTAQLQWRPQHVCVSRSNLCKHTSFSVLILSDPVSASRSYPEGEKTFLLQQKLFQHGQPFWCQRTKATFTKTSH